MDAGVSVGQLLPGFADGRRPRLFGAGGSPAAAAVRKVSPTTVGAERCEIFARQRRDVPVQLEDDAASMRREIDRGRFTVGRYFSAPFFLIVSSCVANSNIDSEGSIVRSEQTSEII